MGQSDLAFEAWVTGFAGLLPHRREYQLDDARLSVQAVEGSTAQ